MRFRDLDEFSASNGVFECDFIQLASRPVDSRALRVSLDRLLLVRGTENVPYAVRAGARANLCTLLLPLASSSETVWRGRKVDERTLLSYQPGAEHVARSGGGLDWATVLYEPDVIKAAAGERHVDGSTIHEVDPAALGRLRAALQETFTIAESSPGMLDDPGVRQALEESVLEAAVVALDPNGERVRGDGSSHSHERIVRRAEEVLLDQIEAPIYVGELCAAASVSERTLRNAFQSIYGMSPIRYLHLRRLHQVRRALRRDPLARITEVALRYGFGNIGRFAVDYRKQFGETPSHTRSAAQAAAKF